MPLGYNGEEGDIGVCGFGPFLPRFFGVLDFD